MSQTFPWPNPQHSLDVINYLFTGQHLSPGVSYAGFFSILQELALVGILVSVVFLVLFIFFSLRHEALHHKMREERHHQEEAHHAVRETVELHPNRARWQQIMERMASPREADWRAAIIDADVMLDALLTERGFAGTDVGEKLQSAGRGSYTSIESAWEAHRTRNAIAHGGTDFALTDRQARIAIDSYRRVFEEFNYI